MAKIVNFYPVGIQTFENIREGDYLYGDKTKYIVDFREKKMKVCLSELSETIWQVSPFASTLQGVISREERNFLKDWLLPITKRMGEASCISFRLKRCQAF